VYCGRLWDQEESKSAFQEVGNLLDLWFKETQQSYVVVIDTQLTEKTLHIAPRSGTEDLEASNSWIDSSSTVLCSEEYQESAKV